MVTLDTAGVLIIVIPFVNFAYCLFFKMWRYRNDMGRLVATIAVVTNREIPKRFKMFVRNDVYRRIKGKDFVKFPDEKSFYKQQTLNKQRKINK